MNLRYRSVKVPVLPLVTVAILALGMLISDSFFAGNKHFSVWLAVKPGMLVNLAEEAGRLEIPPFPDSQLWYHTAANVHSYRWANVLEFLSLHYTTGLPMRELTRAPWGVVWILLGGLFMMWSLKRHVQGVRIWGFVFFSALFLTSWLVWGWSYHSGAWPAVTIFALMLGTLVAPVESGNGTRNLLLTLIFGVLIFHLYHAMMVVVAVFFVILFAYTLALWMLSRARGIVMPATNRLPQYFALAAMFTALISFDFMFEDLLTTYSYVFLSPIDTLQGIFRYFFVTRGDYGPYFMAMPTAERIFALLPLASLLLLSACLWVADQVLPLARRQPLSGSQVISGAAFLTVGICLFLGAIAGGFRMIEAYFVVLLTVPLLVVQHVRVQGVEMSRRSYGWAPIAGTIVTALSIVSFVFLVRSSFITEIGTLDHPETVAAEQAADKMGVPYFADTNLTGIILLANPRSPIIDTGADFQNLETIERLYSGAPEFADVLMDNGALAALLTKRNFVNTSGDGRIHYLITPDFIAKPLPGYDFTTSGFEILYTNGGDKIVILDSEAVSAPGAAPGLRPFLSEMREVEVSLVSRVP